MINDWLKPNSEVPSFYQQSSYRKPGHLFLSQEIIKKIDLWHRETKYSIDRPQSFHTLHTHTGRRNEKSEEIFFCSFPSSLKHTISVPPPSYHGKTQLRKLGLSFFKPG